MRESLEPESNVKLESAAHSQKQYSQTTSTDDGMQIDEKENALITVAYTVMCV
jgi:hypothetical protein